MLNKNSFSNLRRKKTEFFYVRKKNDYFKKGLNI
jgi:hypothetical protein